jgi:NDP-sugar pyrophosphorylase family protein
VILAGGRGRRLEPYTHVLPKPLMPVGDMPILEIVLRQLSHYKITDVILAVGYLSSLVQAFAGDGSRFGLNITYSLEEKPLGPAGPLKLIGSLDSTFVLMNGDLLTSLDFLELVRFHREQGATATVAICPRHVQVSLGVIEADAEHNIVKYVEKPSYDFWVSMGISVLEPAVLDFLPGDGYCDFPDLIRSLVGAGEKTVAYPFADGYWLDIGRHEDYQKALEDLDYIHRLIPGSNAAAGEV